MFGEVDSRKIEWEQSSEQKSGPFANKATAQIMAVFNIPQVPKTGLPCKVV